MAEFSLESVTLVNGVQSLLTDQFLTPSVQKTVMRCLSSCPFCTENRNYKRYPIISYLTFIIEIHYLNVEKKFQR